MTRKTAVMGLGWLSGLLAASFFALWLSVSAGIMLVCFGLTVIFIVRPEKASRLFAFSAAALFCGMGLLYYSGYDYFVCRPISSANGASFEGSAVIKDVTAYSEDSAFCTAQISLPDGRKADIGWYACDGNLARGDKAQLSGILYSPENTSFFNSADYYRSQNIFLLLNPRSECYIKNENGLFHRLCAFRENAVSVIRSYVPSDEGELIIGMTLGNGLWRISDKAENALYRSGIGHIASVSGMHMAVAAGIVSALASALCLSKKSRLSLICIACALFALTADMGVSVLRAYVMTVLVYTADLFRRQNDGLTSLTVAAVILTVGSPFAVRSASFLLSFSGVFGVSVLAPSLNSAIRRAYERRYEDKMGFVFGFEALLSSLCASAAVIPASALCLDEISLIAPVSNLIMSPLFTAAMTLSMAGILVSVLPLQSISGGFFLIAGALCRPVLMLTELFGNLPFASLPSGTAVAPPIIALIIITAGASHIIMKNRSAVILTVSGAVLAGAVCITFYRAVPDEYARAVLLTEGNGGVLILSEDNYCTVIDFMGNSKSVKAVKKYLAKADIPEASLVAVTEHGDYAAPLYVSAFPNAQVFSQSTCAGLTYTPDGDIIKFGNVSFIPSEDHFRVQFCGSEILCVNRKCEPPRADYNMCILDCRSSVEVSADIYAVTNKSYSGNVPISSLVIPQGGEFIVSDGIFLKEEQKWLR